MLINGFVHDLPPGGNVGDVLVKKSADAYNTEWRSATKVNFGDGLEEDDNNVSVVTPVRGVYTQEEFDVLSNSDASKGFYIVADDTPMAANVNVLSQGFSANVYSTDETPIGVWIDGKTIYRKVINCTAPSSTSSDQVIASVEGISYLVHFYGSGTDTDGNFCPEPFVWPVNQNNDGFWVEGNTGYIHCNIGSNRSHMVGRPLTLILEYTKVDD